MEYTNPNISHKTAEKLSSIERQFIFMRANGDSIRNIAKKMKKSTRDICVMNKKFTKDIFNIRNAQFSELQKKVIDLKFIRLNFLKGELEKIINVLQKNKLSEDEPYWQYNDSLELFIRLSDLMSACEYDMLTVGTNFKENLQPESNDLLENGIDIYENNVSCVSENRNNVSKNSDEQLPYNKETYEDGKQMKTNNNTQQHTKIKNKSL